MSKPPTVICNTGLGDFIVLSGAFVELAKRHGALRVPCLSHNLPSCRAILINHPEIEIFTIEDDSTLRREYRDYDAAIQCYWTRVEGIIYDPDVSWDVWMYEELDVPFEHRWDSCPIERAADQVAQIHIPGSYYLIHEDTERGYTINYPPVHPYIRSYRIFKSGLPILAWIDVIKRASELHFIDSAFWHLTESLALNKNRDLHKKLFVHRYARFFKPAWHAVRTQYPWIFLDA